MKKTILAILLAGVLVIASACTSPTATATVAGLTQPVILQETATPDQADVAPTATFPLIITATPGEATPIPAATAAETTAPMPTVMVAGGTAERLTFPNGGTAINLNGNVAAQGKRSYVLSALKDQYMMVNLDSLSTALSLEITSGSGQTTLLPAASLAKAWKGTLTETQDYRIDVVSTSTTADDYSLQVIVPQRIRFAPGGISATVSGSVSENGVSTYLAGARKGQTMTVTITSSTNDIFLTIYGLTDGQPLVSASAGQTTWTGVLPLDQDYVIDAVASGTASLFSLKLTIP